MPLSRPMPTVATGAHELRVREGTMSYRLIYGLRPGIGVLLLVAFAKKTRATPEHVVALAQKRLGELVDD
jgi:phage-related protein